MHVLVATKETQGQRKNDFCHASDGEIVNFVFECDGESVDGDCGCKRSMGGISTHKATTTVMVVEMSITQPKFIHRIRESLIKGGWAKVGVDASELAVADAKELLRIANWYNIGDVLEKRGNKFVRRRK
jgi:hypothetical protein